MGANQQTENNRRMGEKDSEIAQLKKKLETDYNDLEIQLAHAIRQSADYSRNNKLLTTELKDSTQKLIKADKKMEETNENMMIAERKSNLLTGQIDTLRKRIEVAEKDKKQAESELDELNESMNLLKTQNAQLTAKNRKFDNEMHNLQMESELIISECRAAEAKSKKAQVDVEKLSEELKKEEDAYNHLDKSKKSLEGQVRDLQCKLD